MSEELPVFWYLEYGVLRGENGTMYPPGNQHHTRILKLFEEGKVIIHPYVEPEETIPAKIARLNHSTTKEQIRKAILGDREIIDALQNLDDEIELLKLDLDTETTNYLDKLSQ